MVHIISPSAGPHRHLVSTTTPCIVVARGGGSVAIDGGSFSEPHDAAAVKTEVVALSSKAALAGVSQME